MNIATKSDISNRLVDCLNRLHAPLDLNAPCPFIVWRGVSIVIQPEEHPGATVADLIAYLNRSAKVAGVKDFAPYLTLGTLRDAPLSVAAQEQWAKRGFPDLIVGRARDDAHFENCGSAMLLDYDINDPDILVDGPAALGRLKCFGACWPSYSYGLVNEKTGKIKRGGRLLIFLDRVLLPQEFKAVARVLAKMTGNHAGPEAMKPCQPQGLPVRRSAEVDCPVSVSADSSVLRADVLLEIAALLGVMDQPHRPAIQPNQNAPTLLDEGVAARSANFSVGVDDRPPPPPVDLRLAIDECPMLAETFATGGYGDPEPLWRLKLLAARFDINPRETARALSKGDPTYAIEDTDHKRATIEKQYAQKKFGWPDCATFKGLGAQQCKTCPHQGEGRSPLHFAFYAQAQREYAAACAAAAAAGMPPPAVAPTVPPEIKAGADALHLEVRAAFRRQQVHLPLSGLVAGLKALVEAEPAVAQHAAHKATMMLLGAIRQVDPADFGEACRICGLALDKIVPGQGAGIVAKIVRGFARGKQRE
ncbi:hypothetical protein [Rhizobium sp. RAF56]|uniref:hypothetical protein n=1 Tax=Rhizobium sp. RAF56 TaxID=3233062 RepID=UPI003F9781EA